MKYRLLSWNVNGIRAGEKKGFLSWLKKEIPFVLAVQETKAQGCLNEAFIMKDVYGSDHCPGGMTLKLQVISNK